MNIVILKLSHARQLCESTQTHSKETQHPQTPQSDVHINLPLEDYNGTPQDWFNPPQAIARSQGLEEHMVYIDIERALYR